MRAPIRVACLCVVVLVASVAAQPKPGLTSKDLHRLQSVGDVQMSPTGTHVAYSVMHSERPGRPYSDTWIKDLATGVATKLEDGSGPRWSPDGQWLAYFGRLEEGSGLIVADKQGEGARLIAPVLSTNHPLPSSGERIAWSPDGRFVAYVSATPGPESDEANGDPMVITRYLYKPTATEGLTRFNDNRRLHIFVAEVTTARARQLTSGVYYEHSIDWSPKGDEILFVSNREANPDRFFNYDIFTVRVRDGVVRRITTTKSAEYYPVWSPDGTRIAYSGTTRDLTSSETTMEDTHVWLMNADGSNRREVGSAIDNRQGAPQWGDARTVYFTVQDRGTSALMRMAPEPGAKPAAPPTPAVVIAERGSVSAWSVGKGSVAYAFSGVEGPAELFVKKTDTAPGAPAEVPTALTTLNAAFLAERARADVESLVFRSFDGLEVEAFLTKPLVMAARHPVIVMIHGGPHGQQGPAFNAKAQVYASRGWASLMVNYRGSTGYGQKLTDAIFKDQNGGEARDVLAAVDAALAKYSWIDATRLGSRVAVMAGNSPTG